jgi:hypothetical protein
MGDGGSLLLGLLVARVTMAAVTRNYLGPSGVIVAALLVGLVIFDTTLVTVSRSRGGRSLMTGACDHLTHRLAVRLNGPRNVALTLSIAQLILCSVTIGVAQAGVGWVLLAGGVTLVLGLGLLWQFEKAGAQLPPKPQRSAEPVPTLPVVAVASGREPVRPVVPQLETVAPGAER